MITAFSAVAFTAGGQCISAPRVEERHNPHIEIPKLWEQSPIKPLFSQDTVTICIMGDIMMHSKQIETAKTSEDTYDFSSYFSVIKDRISAADIAIANMEFTLAGKPYSGYPAFSAPDCYAEYLAECGFDIFLTANNHILDKGGKGAERTLERYRELTGKYNIRTTGTAENQERRDKETPLSVLTRGIKISIINFTYGTNLGSDTAWPKTNYMSDKVLIQEALKKSEDSDFILVLPHWGTEYSLSHSRQQEDIALWLAENGADMIIGSHPHVPQDCQRVSDRSVMTAYSLGNAVSNMSAANTQLGLMATIRLVRKSNGDIEILNPLFTYLWCSRPGGYNNSYTIIPVKEYLGKKDEWMGAWDYEKMVSTYGRVRKTIEIEDN